MKPQRFGVIDGGLGSDVIPGLVVLLDGVLPEPVFDAGVIVIEPPEGLGCGSAMEPTIENPGNGLGQSDLPANCLCPCLEYIHEELPISKSVLRKVSWLWQAGPVEFIQEPFKETGAKTC